MDLDRGHVDGRARTGPSWLDQMVDSLVVALGGTTLAFIAAINVLGWTATDAVTVGRGMALFIVMILVVFGIREHLRPDHREALDPSVRAAEVEAAAAREAAVARAEEAKVDAELRVAAATADAAAARTDFEHCLRCLDRLTKYKTTELFEATTATYELEPDGSATITSERLVTVPASSHLYWRRLAVRDQHHSLSPDELAKRTRSTKAEDRRVDAFALIDSPTALETVVFFDPPVGPDDPTTEFTWTHQVYWPRYFHEYESNGIGDETIIGVATGCITIRVILPVGHVIEATASPLQIGEVTMTPLSDGRSCAEWSIESAAQGLRHTLNFRNLAHEN